MSYQFKLGDIVQLKSGGPSMTVSKCVKSIDDGSKGYWCEWFKGASKERAHFNEETLQVYVAPKKT